MASLQVDATPLEDVITDAEATPQLVAAPPPPPPESVKSTVDVEEEDEEEGVEELTAPAYEGEVENWDDEEEKDDIKYSPLMEREGGAGQPAATFGDFNEDDEEEDDDAA
ncbi:hypothetical protein Salat_2384800 [Sesamum alatum]|uniref:Uncharacterized protein n=1 Tax=Sesamum alatum TaxID=300844 RepID=A0AAE2CEZ9_9LAMI|nr:hypothetical protein Salat_2384800 [Sesamum alatum]